MSRSVSFRLALFLSTAYICLGVQSLAPGQVSFTYQGELRLANVPVNGANNFEFTLYDADNANQVLGNSVHAGVNVVNGRFTVLLNFAAASQEKFDGRNLDLGIKVNGGAEMPRVRIQPVPLALGLKLPFKASRLVNGANCVFDITTTGTGRAICGHGTGLNATGVYGEADNGTLSYGVWGKSAAGYGVVGDLAGASGFTTPADLRQAAIWGDTDSGNGVQGTTSQAGAVGNVGGAGVFGVSKNARTAGVSGHYKDAAASGWGVYGTLVNTTGLALGELRAGVLGDSTVGNGVTGLSTLAVGAGVFGRNDNVASSGVTGTSANGFGVFGNTANTVAVCGRRNGGSGAIVPSAALWGDANGSNGLLGTSIGGGHGGAGIFNGLSGYISDELVGLWGDTNAGGGVIGTSSFALGVGVHGRCDAPLGIGVRATNDLGTALHCDTALGLGVRSIRGGVSLTDLTGIFVPAIWGDTSIGNGVMGTSSAANSAGVFGKSDNILGTGVSGKSPAGIGTAGGSNSGVGVYGALLLGSGINLAGVLNPGVWGDSNIGNGVLGTSSANTGAGVFGIAAGANGVGVVGRGLNGARAGEFVGNVDVSGNLSKGGGSFKIDHPLDPENKFLYHSFVESPDMKNIYDGVVRLDSSGKAIVEMPDWFEALNRDFRYSLTALDMPAPNLHISARLKNGRFSIGGGSPNMEVSWQLTGIRRDAYANAHRVPLEAEKSAQDRGRYLHPEAFGKPESLRLASASQQTNGKVLIAPRLIDPQTTEPQTWPPLPGESLTMNGFNGHSPYGPANVGVTQPAGVLPGGTNAPVAGPASPPGAAQSGAAIGDAKANSKPDDNAIEPSSAPQQ